MSDKVGNPEDWFSQVTAHISLIPTEAVLSKNNENVIFFFKIKFSFFNQLGQFCICCMGMLSSKVRIKLEQARVHNTKHTGKLACSTTMVKIMLHNTEAILTCTHNLCFEQK